MDTLPVDKIAKLTAGLRPNSRIMTKLSGRKVDLDTLLKAGIYDLVRWMQWAQTKDGQRGHNRPQSVVEALTADPAKSSRVQSFNTVEEWEAERRRKIEIIRKNTEGGDSVGG